MPRALSAAEQAIVRQYGRGWGIFSYEFKATASSASTSSTREPKADEWATFFQELVKCIIDIKINSETNQQRASEARHLNTAWSNLKDAIAANNASIERYNQPLFDQSNESQYRKGSGNRPYANKIVFEYEGKKLSYRSSNFFGFIDRSTPEQDKVTRMGIIYSDRLSEAQKRYPDAIVLDQDNGYTIAYSPEIEYFKDTQLHAAIKAKIQELFSSLAPDLSEQPAGEIILTYLNFVYYFYEKILQTLSVSTIPKTIPVDQSEKITAILDGYDKSISDTLLKLKFLFVPEIVTAIHTAVFPYHKSTQTNSPLDILQKWTDRPVITKGITTTASAHDTAPGTYADLLKAKLLALIQDNLLSLDSRPKGHTTARRLKKDIAQTLTWESAHGLVSAYLKEKKPYIPNENSFKVQIVYALFDDNDLRKEFFDFNSMITNTDFVARYKILKPHLRTLPTTKNRTALVITKLEEALFDVCEKVIFATQKMSAHETFIEKIELTKNSKHKDEEKKAFLTAAIRDVLQDKEVDASFKLVLLTALLNVQATATYVFDNAETIRAEITAAQPKEAAAKFGAAPPPKSADPTPLAGEDITAEAQQIAVLMKHLNEPFKTAPVVAASSDQALQY